MHHEGRHVRDLRRDVEVRVAECQHRGGQAAGRIVVAVRAQRGAEIEVGVGCRGTTTRRRRTRSPGSLIGMLLEVAAIAPVGVEETDPAVCERSPRRIAGSCSIMLVTRPTTDQPAGRPGRDPERHARGGEHRRRVRRTDASRRSPTRTR